MISVFLKNKGAAKGAFGNILQTGCEKVISLILFAYLARVLPAEIFGFTAAFMVFVEIGSMLSSSGSSSSLITRPFLTKEVINTLFTASALFGFCFCSFLFLFSNKISSFLNFQDQGIYLCMVASIMFIQGLATVPKAIMSRSLRFSEISKISLLSSFFGSLAAVAVTFTPFSSFSLFTFYFIQSLILTFLFFKVCPFIPVFSFNFLLLKDLSPVALPATTSGFLGMLTDKLVPLTIGKWLGPSDLGMFSLAVRPCAVVWQVLVSSFKRISLPLISATEEHLFDDSRFARFLLPIFLFMCPILFFIFCNSENIILLLFGASFKEASPLLSLVVLSTFFLALSYMGEALFLSSGRPADLYFAVFFRLFLVILCCTFFLGFGLKALLYSLIFCNLISTAFIFFLLFKRRGLNFLKAALIHGRLFVYLFLFCGCLFLVRVCFSSFYINAFLFFVFYYVLLSVYFKLPLTAAPYIYLEKLLAIFD